MSDFLRRVAPALQPTASVAHAQPGQEVIEVSSPASSAASAYEKIRNTFDYQEEHLLRRNAILRILKRYIGDDAPLSSSALPLLRELVWAKYLPNKTIPVHFADTLSVIIAKYEPLLVAARGQKVQGEKMYRWLLDVLATEIEQAMTPSHHEEALAAFMYEEIRKRIDWDATLHLSPEERDLRLYTAVHRVLLKSNPGILRYRLFTLYYPYWSQPGPTTAQQQEIVHHLSHIVRTIEADITHPLADRLMRMLRRKAGVFRVLGDVLQQAKSDDALFHDPEKLDKAVTKAVGQRTEHFRVRLRRTVIRTVAFLFLTKMLLALILELPYDLLVHGGNVPLYPLFINILFHPLFLAFIALTVSLPEKANVANYTSAVRALSVGVDHPLLHVRVKGSRRNSWSTIFGILYVVLFLAVYGLIGYGLHLMHFHALSIGLFLFFLSLVTFFGIRIRMSERDIVLSDAHSGFLGSAFDILLLPIVKAGSWLSTKVSKINIFIYFFDFIIEAPLKVAIDFIEGWLAFVREKKEEI